MCISRCVAMAACIALIIPASRSAADSFAAERDGSARTRSLHVERLSTESLVNPLGIDATRPGLGWVLTSARRGERQTAYQILAASDEAALRDGRADLWDTGKIASAQSAYIVYAGKPLQSGQRVYWTVRVWDRDDRPSAYADAAWFETALLDPSDWRARWITRNEDPSADPFGDRPGPLFRKELTIDRPIARARAYVSGLGYYELRINGKRVGDRVLDPGWTDPGKRVLYATYDVTDRLKPGRNAIGAMLGRGWYDPLPLAMWGRLNLRDHVTTGAPRLIVQLRIDYADGTSQVVGTDDSWRCAAGPVLRDNVYLGEWFDARRDPPAWDRPGFDDSIWPAAALAQEPVGPLHAQDAPPIRIGRVLKARARTEPRPGVFVFDLGQNFAGWARLRVRGPAGTRVSLRYGELLYPDGTLNGMTSVAGQIKAGGKDYRYDGSGPPKTAFQNDVYVLNGKGEEVWTPRFTFHGFRYVEVTGYPGKPSRDAVEGWVLHSDVESAGAFSCSNERFNRIQEMVRRTELSNLFSVQSDCPHREKFGYGGDLVASSEMAMLNFGMERFYAKTVDDFADAARQNGGLTETAPFVGIVSEGLGGDAGPVEWGTAFPLLLWELYQYYGDCELLARNEDAVRRWVALLDSRARDGILDNGISDHESVAPKRRALTGTAFYYWNLRLAERISRALGHLAEADRYAASAGAVRDAFNRRFLRAGTGVYDTGTQACEAFALYLDLIPAAERERALDVLVRDVEARQGHLSTGIFGTRFMLHALTDGGRHATACAIVDQRTYPGWGNMLERGATTLWEHWDWSDDHYSHNHPMFGSVSEWLYKGVAGIAPDPEAVGFDRIVIRPHPADALEWAKARYESVRGTVASAWKLEDDSFTLAVDIPVGATATVYVPAPDSSRVLEDTRPAIESEGVAMLRRERGVSVYRVESGRYRFVAKGFRKTALDATAVRATPVAVGPSLRAPNPTMGALRMTVDLPSATPAKLSIYDVAGRVMQARELGGRVGSQSVDAGTMPPGIYIVKLSQDGRSVTKRVAVVR